MSDAAAQIRVQPLSGTLGAEIHSLDLSRDVDDELFARLRDLFYQYEVVCFRDQQLTPEQHIGFARRWGEINVNRFFARSRVIP